MVGQGGEGVFGLGEDEVSAQRAGMRVRLAEAQAVVGDDGAARGLGQMGREVAP
ncbi:hypothetical protein D3C87_1594340 [compost metagenome]